MNVPIWTHQDAAPITQDDYDADLPALPLQLFVIRRPPPRIGITAIGMDHYQRAFALVIAPVNENHLGLRRLPMLPDLFGQQPRASESSAFGWAAHPSHGADQEALRI